MRKYNLIVIQIHSTQKNVILASTIKLRINQMEMCFEMWQWCELGSLSHYAIENI